MTAHVSAGYNESSDTDLYFPFTFYMFEDIVSMNQNRCIDISQSLFMGDMIPPVSVRDWVSSHLKRILSFKDVTPHMQVETIRCLGGYRSTLRQRAVHRTHTGLIVGRMLLFFFKNFCYHSM